MCGPALPIISLAMTAVSTVVGMQSAQAQAKAQSDTYEYQAKVAENNARIAGKQAESQAVTGAQKAQLQFTKDMRIKASQAAAFSANGMDIGAAGSPLDVLSDTARISQLDKANLEYDAGQNTWAYKNQANDYVNQASLNRVGAQNALIAGRNNSTAVMLTGLSSMAGSAYKMNSEGAFSTKTAKVPKAGG